MLPGDDGAELLSRLQKKYKTINDIAVTFDQHTLFGVSKSESRSKGTIVMKKGNKYRIEFSDRTIVTDGASVWSYSKTNNQVIINRYKEDSKTFSPDKVLLTIPEDYQSAVAGKETIGGIATSILQLTPKAKRSNIKWMKIWVDANDTMRKVQLSDATETTMTYELSDIRLNPGIADSAFSYKAASDVEVIDLR
jgi:chaperone LolA